MFYNTHYNVQNLQAENLPQNTFQKIILLAIELKQPIHEHFFDFLKQLIIPTFFISSQPHFLFANKFD